MYLMGWVLPLPSCDFMVVSYLPNFLKIWCCQVHCPPLLLASVYSLNRQTFLWTGFRMTNRWASSPSLATPVDFLDYFWAWVLSAFLKWFTFQLTLFCHKYVRLFKRNKWVDFDVSKIFPPIQRNDKEGFLICWWSWNYEDFVFSKISALK